MKLFKDIAVSVCLTFLFLLLIEGLFRIAGLTFEGSFYQPDRELGYALRPNAHAWNVLENQNYFEVNADGMADQTHSPQRPDGVIRIAVVGDSVSEAKQVARGQTYWAVMERLINSRLAPTGHRVEVLNFGVAGYGLAQEALVIDSARLWKYDPQMILLAGTMESLVLRSTRQLSPNNASEHVPFYIYRNLRLEPDDQTLRERAAFQGSKAWFGDWINLSRVLALGNEGVKKSTEELKGRLGHQSPANAYRESDAFRGPATPELKSAWDLSEALILRCQAEARQHAAEFWLFTLDMPQQVDPQAPETGPDLFVADRLLAEFASQHGILHGTLAPQLQAFARRSKILLHGFPGTPRNSGHWNLAGHRAAGEFIARQLLDSSPLLHEVKQLP